MSTRRRDAFRDARARSIDRGRSAEQPFESENVALIVVCFFLCCLQSVQLLTIVSRMRQHHLACE